jgi:hypothetical protein
LVELVDHLQLEMEEEMELEQLPVEIQLLKDLVVAVVAPVLIQMELLVVQDQELVLEQLQDRMLQPQVEVVEEVLLMYQAKMAQLHQTELKVQIKLNLQIKQMQLKMLLKYFVVIYVGAHVLVNNLLLMVPI